MQFYLKNLGNVVNSNPNDFENPPEYITDEFSPWSVWLSHLVLLVKLAFKNKMYNKIKLETQDQRVLQSTQGQLLSDNYQCSLHCGWMSYELLLYVQIRVCFFPLYFPKLKLYNVLKLHSFCSVLKSFFAFNILALNCIALTVCSLNK